MTVYKKFEKTVHVVELHSITIDGNTKDDEGNTIGSLKNCKLRMHVIDSNNNAEANEKDWAYKNSGENVKEIKPLYNWNSTQTPADDADSKEGICRSNKFVHSAKNENGNGIINIVTKAYFKDANGNNSPCLIDVVNEDRLLGTITVYTEPFIAKNFVRYYDNVGYGELNPDDDSKTKNMCIYVETSRVMQGDSFYVLCNSDNVEYSAKVTGKGANNVNVVKKDVGEGEIAKYRILGPKGRSDITKVDTTFAKGCRYSIEAKTWYDTWSVIENMPNLILSVTVTDKGVAEDYAKDNTTTLLSEIRAIPHSGIINHIWEYNVDSEHSIGEYIWGSTKYNNCSFEDYRYDSNINNSDFRYYSSIRVDLNNFSNFTMDPPAGRELYATHYTFPDLLDSRTPYACAAGTLVDSSDSSASDFKVPSDIVQSPLYSSSAPADHKYLSHLAWSKNENSATLKKHKSAGAIGKDSAEKPVTESLNNGTLERYLVNISSPTETGRTSCLKAGTGLYLKDNALAAFTTENDDGVSKYLYFIVPSDTIYVTYQIVKNGDKKQPWYIIKKGNSDSENQIKELYNDDDDESTRLSGVEYEKGEAANINLSGANLFGYDTYLNFRGNKITSTSNPKDNRKFRAMSGTNEKNSVLLYDNLDAMLGRSVRNGTGMANEAWDNRPMLRLNASKLGWLKRDVKYVDVNITVILNDVGYKQITFPYRLMVNNNNQ